MKTKSRKTTNILFCGLGGQGVLTASEICGVAAMTSGFHVKKSEVHGMAQRGGAVESHLRFGDLLYSPLILKGDVDILVASDTYEANYKKNLCKKNYIDLSCHITHAKKQIRLPCHINIWLLGILSMMVPFEVSIWRKAFLKVMPKMFFYENYELFKKARFTINPRRRN